MANESFDDSAQLKAFQPTLWLMRRRHISQNAVERRR
jgi:hypothetical protein